MTQTASIIGGGVIGGGWAARFLLSGWNVQVFDPDPDAERKIGEVLDNARRSLPGLSDVALPEEGRLRRSDIMDSISDSVFPRRSAIWDAERRPSFCNNSNKASINFMG